VVEHLPSKCEVLSTTKKIKKLRVRFYFSIKELQADRFRDSSVALWRLREEARDVLRGQKCWGMLLGDIRGLGEQ
jgi:hypothetical protein